MKNVKVLAIALLLTSAIVSVSQAQKPATIKVRGLEVDEYLGVYLSGIGDINNDGIPDVMVGSPRHSANGESAGRVYVHSGVDGVQIWGYMGALAGDQTGYSVSEIGDIDDDGISDYMFSSTGSDINLENSGRVDVFTGKNGARLYTFFGEGVNHAFGTSISNAGDVNGDSYPDMIISAPGNRDADTAFYGKVYVYSGKDTSLIWSFDGESSTDDYGYSVSGAGDVNMDGYDDIIIGGRAGKAFVHSGFDGSILYTFDEGGNYLGHTVSSAGDANNDGYADVIVGLFVHPEALAFVYSGKDGTKLYSIPLDTTQTLGSSELWVSEAGDVNNDGFADQILGDFTWGTNFEGKVVVYSGADGSLLYEFFGEEPLDAFGAAVANLGDVDQNGVPDFLIGAPFADLDPENDDNRGLTYIVMPCCNLAGDANNNDEVTVGDVITIVYYVFGVISEIECFDKIDTNGSSSIDITDAIHLLRHIFGGAEPTQIRCGTTGG